MEARQQEKKSDNKSWLARLDYWDLIDSERVNGHSKVGVFRQGYEFHFIPLFVRLAFNSICHIDTLFSVVYPSYKLLFLFPLPVFFNQIKLFMFLIRVERRRRRTREGGKNWTGSCNGTRKKKCQ